MSGHKNIEMAIADNPEEIVLATQRSFVAMLIGIIKDVKKESKQPGLTWDQIEQFLEYASKKKPEIWYQEGEM